jgi:hypothetical protein
MLRAAELLTLDVREPAGDLWVRPPAHRAATDAPFGLFVGDSGDCIPDAWPFDTDADHAAPRAWAAGVVAELLADAELAPWLSCTDRAHLALALAALRGELAHPALTGAPVPAELLAQLDAAAEADDAAELAAGRAPVPFPGDVPAPV